MGSEGGGADLRPPPSAADSGEDSRTDSSSGEAEQYYSWEDLGPDVDKVPLIHRDWEAQFIFREGFGKSFVPPTEVSPTRTAPPMDKAPNHSPLKPEAFERLLARHPNRPFVQWLVASIRDGFKNYSDIPETDGAVHAPLHSALEWSETVSEWIAGEVEA